MVPILAVLFLMLMVAAYFRQWSSGGELLFFFLFLFLFFFLNRFLFSSCIKGVTYINHISINYEYNGKK